MQETFEEWLEEEIDIAAETVMEHRRVGGNQQSYGTGYDKGFLDALVEVKKALYLREKKQ